MHFFVKEHSDTLDSDDIIKMLASMENIIFVGEIISIKLNLSFQLTTFSTEMKRNSYVVFVLNGTEAINNSVQFHVLVHR